MKPVSFAYESMGTHWEISLWDPIEESALDELKNEIIQSSNLFDKTYSRFIASSFISDLATRQGDIEVPPDFIEIVRLSMKLNDLSEKKFNPLIGTTLSDMGYDAQYTLRAKNTITQTPDLHETVKILDETHIHVSKPVLFDIGAIGKGFFVEQIKQKIFAKGYRQFLVNGSGDVAYVGAGHPIRMGLEHPLDTTKIIGVIEIEKGSMCSSGGNRRAWGEYHHIIDPLTLTSPKEILASWVLAETATLADALATALFLSPPEAFEKEFQFEYLLVNQEMKVKRSAGFNAQLF